MKIKPKKYFSLCFLLLGLTLVAQKESTLIDSLKKRLLSPKNDSDRSYILDALARDYFDTNLDSSLSYSNRSLVVAEKIGLVEYQVDALNSMGIATRKKGNFKEALAYHYEALKRAKEHKLSPHYLQAIYSTLTLVFTDEGNFSAALEYGFKALHEVELQKDTYNLAVTNNNIADIYFHLKQLDKAMLHYRRSLAYAVALHSRYGEGLLAGNIGSVYYEWNKMDSAKLYFEKAVAIAKEVNDVFGEANNLQNLGNYYEKKGQYAEALARYQEAEQLFRENELDPDLAVAYFNMATVYLNMKDYSRSKQYAEKSLAVASKIKSYQHLQSAHEALKNVFEKLGDVKMAYYHYREYVAARDSIFNQENRKALFKSELQYEYMKKHDADSLNQLINARVQQEQLQQEQLRTQTQRKFTYAAMIGCALLLVLVIFIFKGYKDKQKANQIITEQKMETEYQKMVIEEKQKEILDSIHYARRIQQSLLPSEKYLERTFKRILKK